MKKIIYLGLFLASFALFTSSKSQLNPPTIEQVRESFLSNTSLNYYDPQQDGESDMVVEVFSIWTNEKIKAIPKTACYSSPAMMYNYLVNAVEYKNNQNWWLPETFYTTPDFKNNFKVLFGLDPIAKMMKIPQNNDNKIHTFKFFNPKALQAAFDKLYVKPETKFQSLTYQKIYDVSFKEYFRESAEIITVILKDKKLFKKLATEYLKKATKEKDFNGLRLVNEYEFDHFSVAASSFKCSKFNRVLSIMLRRDADASLPVMLSCFKTILKDYDKETFEKYKNNF